MLVHGHPPFPYTAHLRSRLAGHHNARGRVAVSTKNGKLLELAAVVWIDATHVNGRPVDAVLSGRATKMTSLKQFAGRLQLRKS